uniref:Uncharacterized protein n=1 Tax=Octopus bimaculoides TaxID=37653 RepID=A0A0L8I3H1_OCTBM
MIIFFIQIKDKPVSLLCSELVSVIKEYYVERHYISKLSSHYESFQEKKEIDNISLSRRTVIRQIDELTTNVELGLKRLSLHFKYFSLAIDESTDVSNTAQLAVFVRGIDEDLNITEEMFGLRGIKDTTTGEDIFQELKMLMARFNLHFKNLHALSTDGAPAMVGSKAGLVSKTRLELASGPKELQIELIEFQGNEDLKREMRGHSLIEFYKSLPRENFPLIVDFSRKKMSLFGNTYKYKQLFSKMKSTKSKARSRITDNHLENNLRVATSSISSNIEMLVKKHQLQISH